MERTSRSVRAHIRRTLAEQQEEELLQHVQALQRPCTHCGHWGMTEVEQKTPWRKILYEKQEYPDNYIGASFLSSLITNGGWEKLDYLQSIFNTLIIDQRVSVVAIFVMVFHITSTATAAIEMMMIINGMFFVLAYCLVLYINQPKSIEDLVERIFHNAVQMGLFSGALFGLAPILRTLTRSYSSDTIYLLTFLLCVVHLAFHDYHPMNKTTNSNSTPATFEATLSLNAAIFASVLLASRLPSSQHAFCFIFLSFCMFLGLPLLSDEIRRHKPERWHAGMTAMISSLAFALIWGYNKQIAFLFLFILFFINIVCTAWLQYIQRYKNNLRGPWDYDTEHELDSENM